MGKAQYSHVPLRLSFLCTCRPLALLAWVVGAWLGAVCSWPERSICLLSPYLSILLSGEALITAGRQRLRGLLLFINLSQLPATQRCSSPLYFALLTHTNTFRGNQHLQHVGRKQAFLIHQTTNKPH